MLSLVEVAYIMWGLFETVLGRNKFDLCFYVQFSLSPISKREWANTAMRYIFSQASVAKVRCFFAYIEACIEDFNRKLFVHLHNQTFCELTDFMPVASIAKYPLVSRVLRRSDRRSLAAIQLEELAPCTSLRELSLNKCGIKSLEGFPNLPNLELLKMSDNLVAGGLDALVKAGLANLEVRIDSVTSYATFRVYPFTIAIIMLVTITPCTTSSNSTLYCLLTSEITCCLVSNRFD